MSYSPHPPDCTEYIEKTVMPAILKLYKHFCITVAVFILIPVITYFLNIQSSLFWIYIIFFILFPVYFGKKSSELECPNCNKPIIVLSMIPKNCHSCRPKFKN